MQLANTQQKAFKSACVISCITIALKLAVSNITLGISPNMTDHLKKQLYSFAMKPLNMIHQNEIPSKYKDMLCFMQQFYTPFTKKV